MRGEVPGVRGEQPGGRRAPARGHLQERHGLGQERQRLAQELRGGQRRRGDHVRLPARDIDRRGHRGGARDPAVDGGDPRLPLSSSTRSPRSTASKDIADAFVDIPAHA